TLPSVPVRPPTDIPGRPGHRPTPRGGCGPVAAVAAVVRHQVGDEAGPSFALPPTGSDHHKKHRTCPTPDRRTSWLSVRWRGNTILVTVCSQYAALRTVRRALFVRGARHFRNEEMKCLFNRLLPDGRPVAGEPEPVDPGTAARPGDGAEHRPD